MKVQKLILAGLFFLAFGSTTAFAAPAAAEEKAPVGETAVAMDSRPTDVFGVSVIAAAADCGLASAKGGANAADPWSVCGSCSIDICDGQPVNSICGYSGGQFLRCQDWLGSLCPRQDGARCRCSNAPIP